MCSAISTSSRRTGSSGRSSATTAWSAGSGLEQQRDRAVVDELDLHHRAEDAALCVQPLAEALVQRLGVLRPGGGDVARAVALAGVPIERELADAQDLAVAERLVHPPVGVGEHPQ